ncbi:hypothetical protein ACGFX4_39795 [Kitasatospora sp. NPDC048365]|uniref:hypothetical protein n=1 Tax=Kitasatospora sp. NPDC048365 TaxID=3364050 RepID=UPI003714356C
MARTRCATPTVGIRLPAAASALGTAAVLLTGCGGGGTSDGPGTGGSSVSSGYESSPAVEGNPSAEQRVSPGAGGGGFNTAGQLSGNVGGIWPNANVKVKNDATSGTFTGAVSKVYNCTPGEPQVQAAPVSSTKLTLPAGTESGTISFKFSTDVTAGTYTVCAVVTANDGSSKTVTGGVVRQEEGDNPGQSTGGSSQNPGVTPDTPNRPGTTASTP